MSTVTDSDIKELKELMIKQFDQVNNKIDKVSEDVNSLRVEIAFMKGELTGINKRLENSEFATRTIFVAVIGALFAGLAKLFLPNFPQ